LAYSETQFGIFCLCGLGNTALVNGAATVAVVSRNEELQSCALSLYVKDN